MVETLAIVRDVNSHSVRVQEIHPNYKTVEERWRARSRGRRVEREQTYRSIHLKQNKKADFLQARGGTCLVPRPPVSFQRGVDISGTCDLGCRRSSALRRN